MAWLSASLKLIMIAIHRWGVCSWSAVRVATLSMPLPTPAHTAAATASAINGAAAIKARPMPIRAVPREMRLRARTPRQRA